MNIDKILQLRLAIMVEDLINAGLPEDVAFTAADYTCSAIYLEECRPETWSWDSFSLAGGFPWSLTPEGGHYWRRYFKVTEAVFLWELEDDVEYAACYMQDLLNKRYSFKKATLATDLMYLKFLSKQTT
jgi:hypothetical protein